MSFLLLGLGILLCYLQSEAVKKIMLDHDSVVAGSLLKQNVPPEVIASVYSNTQDDGQGEALLTKLGYTEKTAVRFFCQLDWRNIGHRCGYTYGSFCSQISC